jgi:hypothetical protein
VSTGQVVIAIALALALAWALRPAQATPPPSGVQVVLPPIPLTGVSAGTAESILSRMQPSIRPRIWPPGWTISWPSVEIPTDFGTARVDLPPTELPLVPYDEVLAVSQRMHPQIVNTENGLAVQITVSVST